MTVTLLYVQDALRAQNCSTYGYTRETTPTLTALAEEGAALDGITPATWTLPAAASILTGMRPFAHSSLAQDSYLSSTLTTIPELLPASVRTVAITAAGFASSEYGFDRGFDDFVELRKENQQQTWAATASELSDEVISAVESEKENHDHLFLLAWSVGPHWPYTEEGRWGNQQNSSLNSSFHKALSKHGCSALIDRYDDQIYNNDQELKRIIEYLKSNEIYDESCIIVVGDHGEGFGESLNKWGTRNIGHRNIPYDELIKVPFVIKPREDQSSADFPNMASLIDLGPTICEMFVTPPSKQLQGRNLFNLQNREPVVTQSKGKAGEIYEVIRSSEWKFIRAENTDRIISGLKSNPISYIRSRWVINELLLPIVGGEEEKIDKKRQNPTITDNLRKKLKEVSSRDLAIEIEPETIDKLSQETEEILRNLGYLEDDDSG